jgi:hypothetical protein
MTTRRTVLNVEQLGERVLPSAAAAVVPATSTAAKVSTPTTVQTTTGAAWDGEGRFTIATAKTTGANTYTLEGSADIGSAGFLAISGSVTTVGSKAGQATGKVVLSNSKGTLTLTLTGPTQSAKSGLPASFSYKVASGTGYFAHYSGTGTIKLNATLFMGYTTSGHLDITTTAPITVVTTPTKPTTPTTPPPVQTTTGPSWTGQGRYTMTTSGAKTYTLEGTADFPNSTFFTVSGTIQTVGAKAGQATGKITLSSPDGTLVLAVTGPTQSANSALPAKLTYKVVSGNGLFAHYAGQGTIQISTPLFLGYTDRGQFSVAVKPTAV